ncbi:thioesterase family protein [Streptosporangium amethystogenes]|uniref:thioesterase family protein n=1 Tax=Streptosporangium amethystogenes TaxID=2002 RepID=UPI0037A41A32
MTAEIGALLRKPVDDLVDPGKRLWGFGGVHGGLTLALLTAAMGERAPGALLQSSTARYHRPLYREFRVEVSPVRSGRTLSSLAGRATTGQGVHVDASATFGSPGRASWPVVSPAAPAAPRPADCEVFTIPPEFVAISTAMEIRAVGPNRPYSGGADAELTAWIRLVEDSEPPDAHRLILLMDGLAPSYSAVLPELLPIPTVEFTVRPGAGLARAESPWVLLHARTHQAGADGWLDERIDAWGPDGDHLGSARQLRLVTDRRR